MALGSQLGGAAQLLFSPSPTPHVLFPNVLKLMAHESPQLRDENVTPPKNGTKSGKHPGRGREEVLGN